MARKKHNARLEKLVARNNERRAKGEVFRVETLFSAKDNRHAEMAEYLGELPRGGASDFIRRAVWEKIQRDEMGISNDPVAQLEQLYHALFEDQERRHQETLYKLAELQRQNDELLQRPVMAAIYPPQQAATTEKSLALPESPGVVQSSGLDMSRPRPRPKAKVISAPAQAPEPEELTEQESVRLAKIMAASIKRAQPGRNSS